GKILLTIKGCLRRGRRPASIMARGECRDVRRRIDGTPIINLPRSGDSRTRSEVRKISTVQCWRREVGFGDALGRRAGVVRRRSLAVVEGHPELSNPEMGRDDERRFGLPSSVRHANGNARPNGSALLGGMLLIAVLFTLRSIVFDIVVGCNAFHVAA